MADDVMATVLISSATTVALLAVLVLLVLLGLGMYFVALRNELVKMRNGLDKSFAEIDLRLRQRHTELPKLVETCRPYLRGGEGTLQALANARSAYTRAATLSQKALADHLVHHALENLFDAATDNPELKRNTSFVQLQTRIARLEEEVAAQRDRYNQHVNAFNARLARMPEALVARLAKLQPRVLFQANQT